MIKFFWYDKDGEEKDKAIESLIKRFEEVWSFETVFESNLDIGEIVSILDQTQFRDCDIIQISPNSYVIMID